VRTRTPPRVTRAEAYGTLTVLANRYEGKRLNSPNDLVYRSDGTLYFSVPPFGLPGFFDDPAKELPFSGVFCLRNGLLKLVSSERAGPDGLAFSPDEWFLYVSNRDEKKNVAMRYRVEAEGPLRDGSVFFEVGGVTRPAPLDPSPEIARLRAREGLP